MKSKGDSSQVYQRTIVLNTGWGSGKVDSAKTGRGKLKNKYLYGREKERKGDELCTSKGTDALAKAVLAHSIRRRVEWERTGGFDCKWD